MTELFAASEDFGCLAGMGMGFGYAWGNAEMSGWVRDDFNAFSPQSSIFTALQNSPQDFVDAYNGHGNLDGLSTGALETLIGSKFVPKAVPDPPSLGTWRAVDRDRDVVEIEYGDGRGIAVFDELIEGDTLYMKNCTQTAYRILNQENLLL